MSFGKKYCQFACNVCPYGIETLTEQNKVFTAYSSHDELVVDQINGALEYLNSNSSIQWTSWETDIEIENNLIFCEICKEIVKSKAVMVEMSDLNFNVIFEYGYSLGLNKKLFPIVGQDFEYENIDRFLKLLLGIGIARYEKNKLSSKLLKKRFWEKENPITINTFNNASILSDNTNITANCLLYLKNSDYQAASEGIENELNQGNLNVILDDPQEEKHSLSWYIKQLTKSYAVIIDMGYSSTQESYHHFLKCAFVGGLAVSTGRRVLIMNSIHSPKPSDIVSIVKQYNNPKDAKHFTYQFLNEHSKSFAIINSYISSSNAGKSTRFNAIDLGEHIAENDKRFLESCYVETAELEKISRQGYKLIIGRKGTGKTAAFYRDNVSSRAAKTIIVRHQFTEFNLNDIYDLAIQFPNANDQDKIVVAFWKFVVFSIIAEQIAEFINESDKYHFQDLQSAANQFMEFTKTCDFLDNGRTVTENLVEIIEEIKTNGSLDVRSIQKEFYENKIVDLISSVIEFIKESQYAIVLSIDGLDSNLTVQRNSGLIMLMIFNLHEVCNSLFGNRVNDYAINLYIRRDIYETIKNEITQKDKITKVILKWDTEDLLRMINARLAQYDIEHIANILSDDFSIRQFMQKMEKYVYPRPRDYLFVFNHLFMIARSLKLERFDTRVFNSAMNYYAIHVFESIEAELLSLPFSVNFGKVLGDIKHKNNDRPRIPLDILEGIIMQNCKSDDVDCKQHLLSFFLRNEFLYAIENNQIVQWDRLINKDSKLQSILETSPSRCYFKFHPIVESLIAKNA
ncbi:MAG: hypothetical protein H6678_02270 [Candidatus Delongbacteria bacterium]|nr:hypothetical protein [Candidatus Delongbacteria bacterium]